MRAVDHYVEAERLLDEADVGNGDAEKGAEFVQAAAVHATLALAGATALQSYARVDEETSDVELDDWQVAAGGEG